MLTAPTTDYRVTDHDLLFNELPESYVLRVKDLPDDERPREKLLNLGPQALSVAELIAIIWGVGTKKEEVLAMARRTLREYGEKAIVTERNPERLAAAADIPVAKGCELVISFELGRRYFAVNRTGRPLQVRNAKQAFQYLKDIGSLQKEQLRGLYLDSRYQVIHDEVISVGSLTSNVIHPREVFQPAIEYGAVAIIVAHNHPSGVAEPTNADIDITEQLVAAGNILGIELLDHLIITKNTHISVMQCLKQDR